MQTGAIRKRTRRVRAANPLPPACSPASRGACGPAGPVPAGSRAGRSAILRKHAAPPPRASYQR